jgi:hypothetical protein
MCELALKIAPMTGRFVKVGFEQEAKRCAHVPINHTIAAEDALPKPGNRAEATGSMGALFHSSVLVFDTSRGVDHCGQSH